MQLISLSDPVHVWPANASLPVAAVALLGTVEGQGDVSRAEVHGLVPPCGGLLTFDTPVAVTLANGAVAATQEAVLIGREA